MKQGLDSEGGQSAGNINRVAPGSLVRQVTHRWECAIERGNLGEFSSLGELEDTGREAGYQKWSQEQRLKGKQRGVLALELESWSQITSLDQMGEGEREGSEWHKATGEYGLHRDCHLTREGIQGSD